jgi:hypothetical protein
MKPVKGGQGPVWAVAPLIIITEGKEKGMDMRDFMESFKFDERMMY